MALQQYKVIITQDLKSYSVSSYDSSISYVSGDVVKDASGDLYKCIVNAPAGTPLSNSTYFTQSSLSTAVGTKEYSSSLPFFANDTIVDPTTGDIYKCIANAPAGTALSDSSKFQKITQGNQSYDASNNTPALSGLPNGTEVFVETAGTQTIGGVIYKLEAGDLVKKSNNGTYSVIKGSTNTVGISKTITNISGNTSLVASDKFSKFMGSPFIATLPALSSVIAGDIFAIKNGNYFGNSVAMNGANTADGSNSSILLMPYEKLELRASVGLTEWEII